MTNGNDSSAPIECPNCGLQYIALLTDDAPTAPPKCIECDALLPPTIEGGFVYYAFSPSRFN